MTSTTNDLDFQTVVEIGATPEHVFDALATTPGVSNWWGPASGSASIDGDLDLTFGKHLVRFRVIDAQRPTRVSWQTVSCDVLPDWVGTTITFELSPSDTDGTTLRFRHAGLSPELPCYEQCSTDWSRYLHRSLVSYLETGAGQPVGS
jgi:uncharacterized protein YndB with AHSA1/START domain